MTASKPHSTQQAFQVVRECLAQGQRAMDELGWTQRDVMVQSTLGRLEEQEEATDKLLREIQRALWHAGFGRGQGRSELDGLFAALGAELGAYPASEPKGHEMGSHFVQEFPATNPYFSQGSAYDGSGLCEEISYQERDPASEPEEGA